MGLASSSVRRGVVVKTSTVGQCVEHETSAFSRLGDAVDANPLLRVHSKWLTVAGEMEFVSILWRKMIGARVNRTLDRRPSKLPARAVERDRDDTV